MAACRRAAEHSGRRRPVRGGLDHAPLSVPAVAGPRAADRGLARAAAVPVDARSARRAVHPGRARARRADGARGLAARAAPVAQARARHLRHHDRRRAERIVRRGGGDDLAGPRRSDVRGADGRATSTWSPAARRPGPPALAVGILAVGSGAGGVDPRVEEPRDARPQPCAGAALLVAIVLVTAAAGIAWLPHDAGASSPISATRRPCGRASSTRTARWHRPFVYPLRLVDRLERRSREDRDPPLPLRWFRGRACVRWTSRVEPWLPARQATRSAATSSPACVAGARLSLGVAVVAAAGALMIGALAGALAGFAGGRLDDVLDAARRLRPHPARDLRRARPARRDAAGAEHVPGLLDAGRRAGRWPAGRTGARASGRSWPPNAGKSTQKLRSAIGAGWWRILLRHLLPATRGFLAVQATLLVPAFILAEATLSFVGLGFAEPTPSWGVMLQSAGAGRHAGRRALAALAGGRHRLVGLGDLFGSRLRYPPLRRREATPPNQRLKPPILFFWCPKPAHTHRCFSSSNPGRTQNSRKAVPKQLITSDHRMVHGRTN